MNVNINYPHTPWLAGLVSTSYVFCAKPYHVMYTIAYHSSARDLCPLILYEVNDRSGRMTVFCSWQLGTYSAGQVSDMFPGRVPASRGLLCRGISKRKYRKTSACDRASGAASVLRPYNTEKSLPEMASAGGRRILWQGSTLAQFSRLYHLSSVLVKFSFRLADWAQQIAQT